MNTTNRGLNRTIIFVIGLLLLLAGAAAIVLAVVPSITSGWQSTAPSVGKHVDATFAAAQIAPGVSWLAIAAIALLVLLIVLLLVFIIRQGNGHTARLFSDETTEHGSTVVRSSVAQTALEEALSHRDDLVSSNVTTYDVKGTPVLKVAATARRGVSPRTIADGVEESLHALDELLGFEVPALVQISGGFRARVAKQTRLQ